MPRSDPNPHLIRSALRAALALLSLALAPLASAQSAPTPVAPATVIVSLEPVVEGLAKPISATSVGDGSGRLVTSSLEGIAQAIDGDAIDPVPLLDLRRRMTALAGEQGFYSLAFHPDFAGNGRLFASYTERDSGDVLVSEFVASGAPPRVPIDAAERTLIRVAVDEPLHHGGQLAFGPDGYLYVGIGDGIRSFEILERRPWPASDPGDLRGKVLRLDVDCDACGGAPYGVPADNPFVGVEGARPEVWALGFRNPWKFSFDRDTGALYLGDVGNDRWEEVNRVVAGGDYGWPRREGYECLRRNDGALFDPDCEAVPTLPPLAIYAHPQIDLEGGNAITGGYVYRGAAQPALFGRYLYADWVSGRIWSLDVDGGGWVELLLDTALNISAFVEDAQGELYLLEIGGTLYRIVAVSTSP